MPEADRFKFGENGWTIEFWVNPETEGNLTGDIIVFEPPIGSGYRLSLENGVPKGSIFQGGSNNVIVEIGGVNGAAALETNRWTHLAFVWSPTENTFRLYRDGVLLTAQQTLANPNFFGAGDIEIVRGFGPNALGFVDELRVWQGVRTNAEIEFWNNRLFPTQESIDLEDYEFGEPLFAYYRFDDGGESIEDFAHLNDQEFYLTIADLDMHLRGGVVVLGHDDADGDGLPEWWVNLHELNEFTKTRSDPITRFDDSCNLLGFEFINSFTSYMSIGHTASVLEDLVFKTTKSNSLGRDGKFATVVKYVNLFNLPAEAILELTAFDTTVDFIFVNGNLINLGDAIGGNLSEGLTFEISSFLRAGRNQFAIVFTRSVTTVISKRHRCLQRRNCGV